MRKPIQVGIFSLFPFSEYCAINIFEVFDLSVWGGVENNFYAVDNAGEFECAMRLGGAINKSVELMGFGYSYAVGVDVNTDARVSFLGRIGFWSEMDMIGGDATFNVMHVFDMSVYKLTLNARIKF